MQQQQRREAPAPSYTPSVGGMSVATSTRDLQNLLRRYNGYDAEDIPIRDRQKIAEWDKKHRSPSSTNRRSVTDLSQVATEELRSNADDERSDFVRDKAKQTQREIGAYPDVRNQYERFVKYGEYGLHQQAPVTPRASTAETEKEYAELVQQLDQALHHAKHHAEQSMAWDIEAHRLKAEIGGMVLRRRETGR